MIQNREQVIRLAVGAAMRSIEDHSVLRFPAQQPSQSLAAEHIRDGVTRALLLLDPA